MKFYKVIKKIKAGDQILPINMILIETGSNYAVFKEYCSQEQSIKVDGISFVSERKDLENMINSKALSPYFPTETPIQ